MAVQNRIAVHLILLLLFFVMYGPKWQTDQMVLPSLKSNFYTS